MAINPLQINDLWAAFPMGYIERAGVHTVGGQTCIAVDGKGLVWVWPEGAQFSRPGQSLFDEARKKLDLLPNLNDHTTTMTIRAMLAERVGMDPWMGYLWAPKAGTSSTGRKVTEGWSLKGQARSATFPVNETNTDTALLKAIALTNCHCSKTGVRACPQHGDISSRPWR